MNKRIQIIGQECRGCKWMPRQNTPNQNVNHHNRSKELSILFCSNEHFVSIKTDD